MELKTKFKGVKVLLGYSGLICNYASVRKTITIAEIRTLVLNYIFEVGKEKTGPDFILSEFIESYEFAMFGEKCDICTVFGLYNEVAELKEFEKYGKLWYDPKNCTQFVPVNVRRFAP